MDTKKALSFKIPTIVEISRGRIGDLLCGAFEGGSNYWYQIDEYIEPTSMLFRSELDTIFRHIDYPLNENGGLVISDTEGDMEPATLNLFSIEKGLNALSQSEQFSHHWQNILDFNDDAETSDVFLQFCLFGDCIYG